MVARLGSYRQPDTVNFHTIASNATEEGHSQNRRVDLVVLTGTDAKSAKLLEAP
jgi:hypothetical protein